MPFEFPLGETYALNKSAQWLFIKLHLHVLPLKQLLFNLATPVSRDSDEKSEPKLNNEGAQNNIILER